MSLFAHCEDTTRFKIMVLPKVASFEEPPKTAGQSTSRLTGELTTNPKHKPVALKNTLPAGQPLVP